MAITAHIIKSGTVHQARRKSVTKTEGRSARPWRRLRLKALIRDKYTCRTCKKVDPDNEVDHIKPLNEGGEDKLENLQTLCHDPCHLFKTFVESEKVAWNLCPDWMPKSSKPLFLVCGKPAAGKSTYVNLHKLPGDLIIDLDLIAREMKLEMHDMKKLERGALIRLRNERLARFLHCKTDHKRCWIVTTAGKPHQREFWQERGAEVIIIESKNEICERRVINENSPAWRKTEKIDAIRNWE